MKRERSAALFEKRLRVLRQALAEQLPHRLRQIEEGWEQLDRQGRHPELGLVTLRQLLSTWVAHDLDHLVQIARVMARRYTASVGPWTQYLRVLRP